jgi:flagellar biosynthetic protein FliQ
MTIEMVADILSDMFLTAMMVMLPPLLASLVLGIVISVFQAATSIQEITLTFVPKIIVTAVTLILITPFIAEKLMSLATRYYNMFAQLVR